MIDSYSLTIFPWLKMRNFLLLAISVQVFRFFGLKLFRLPWGPYGLITHSTLPKLGINGVKPSYRATGPPSEYSSNIAPVGIIAPNWPASGVSSKPVLVVQEADLRSYSRSLD